LDKKKLFAEEIIRLIEANEIKNSRELNSKKIALCKKFSLSELPSNPDILLFAEKQSNRLLKILRVKPTRTLSGVAVVALMPLPYKCPGKCIYCPNSLLPEKETPKSYTGKEPATMRAVNMNFSAKKQILNRLKSLKETGHDTTKIELIVMGGTFPAMPFSRQKKFMLSALNAIAQKNAGTIEKARKNAEHSEKRVVGITFETRPDYCSEREISRMLFFGGTRTELGIQNPDDRIYMLIERGHSVKDVVNATRLLKDSAFKVTYHFMPGLPGSSPKKDLSAIKKIFSNPDFKPDSLKIYPCLVIKGTKLFELWKKGEFSPLKTEEAVKLVSKIKESVPRHVRIMRVQRDIPHNLVDAGVLKTNLRQMVSEEMEKHGKKCMCIRCREAGLLSLHKNIEEGLESAKIFVDSYSASNGKEFFISLEDKKRSVLYGFTRLRIPFRPFRKELLKKTALIRELHVFGKALPLSSSSFESFQHRGIGKTLLEKAEEIASKDFGSKKLAVIAGLGARPYYYALGFSPDNFFVSKKL